MLDVIATGAFHRSLKDGGTLERLNDELKKYCPERPRRIDRFTQLCLLGSGLCKQQLESTDYSIDSHTGLYIGSRFAALTNTINVQEQMVRDGHVPKPAHFINTLSNAAGYYVARNLGLTGTNLFVSRAGLSTEAVLQTASLDLACQKNFGNQHRQGLIGIVDEGVLPLSEHRQRLEVAPGTPLSEGSYWLFVKARSRENPVADGTLSTITDTLTFCDSDELKRWLGVSANHDTQAQYYSCTLSQRQLGAINPIGEDSTQMWDELTRSSPEQKKSQQKISPPTALALLHFITENRWPSLVSINGDEDGRYHLTRVIMKTR